jgi:fumarate hydratase class II
MGSVEIPEDALWGAQTQRAVENFPISGLRFGRTFISTLGHVKLACALANKELGILDDSLSQAIIDACEDVISGDLDEHFPLDIFQTGSGTSTNMNANEVIANRAISLLGGVIGSRSPVHPNDHVNLSQSSNDVIPTTIHATGYLMLRDGLIPALEELTTHLEGKAGAFDHIVKTGRTHLQDATPIRLGQVFSGYAAQGRKSVSRAVHAKDILRELPLGGTAVGTGLNRLPEFPKLAISALNKRLGTDYYEAGNHIEANAARDSLVEASGQLKTIAVSLIKIANDIRWLGSGPRNGLGEIRLPEVQPGSSIMPGKVNPVMAEALIMVAAQVIGHDTAITHGGLGSHFELNTMMPLMAHNLLSSIEWLSAGVRTFTERCISGIEANETHIQSTLEHSLALATGLTSVIQYDQAAEISKEAYREGKTVRQVAEERGFLSSDELESALDSFRMTEPGRIS